VVADAISFLPDSSGVFVRLESGISALLRASEVPGSPADIRQVIDLRDQLMVEVIEVRQDLLEVGVSLNAALRTLSAKEARSRREQFNRDPVETVARVDWGLPRRTDLRVAVLGPDIYFTNHLILWIEAFGYSALRLSDPAHLERILQAPNRPTHVLWSPETWPQRDEPLANALRRGCQEKGVTVSWLNGPRSPSVPPFEARSLDLPLWMDDLIPTLSAGSATSRSTPRGTQGWRFDDYQSSSVQVLVDRLLADLCDEFKLDGALWVVQEQPGRYHIRGTHGLDAVQVAEVDPHLGHSVLADSIEKNEVIEWEFGQLGPLKPLVPAHSDRILCLPIPFTPLAGGPEVVTRVVAFFYRASDHDRALRHRLRPSLAAMQIHAHTLHFARHNESLSALAELGRSAASYLHELGQKALPVQGFLDRYNKPTEVPPEEWSRLRRHLAELVDMARDDLGRMRRRRQERLQLRDRLTRLARLYMYRFNAANCAFSVRLPDLPLLLNLNPLIVDQAVSNLLDNALHFATQLPEAGRVRLEVSLDPEPDPARPLVIAVMDNGPGIRASMRDRLFEPRHSGKEQGTGMGLFIARSFIEGLGGSLNLADRGVRWAETRFEIRLPVIVGQGDKP
jgi:signal transduction histidine kinase